MHDTSGCEFIVALRQGKTESLDHASLDTLRIALLKQSLLEAREQIEFIFGAPASTMATAAETLAKLTDMLAQQSALLEAQANRINEIAEVISWQRKLLAPARTAWRKLRARTG